MKYPRPSEEDDFPVEDPDNDELPPPEPEPERAWRSVPPALLARSERWSMLRVLGDAEPPKIHIRDEKVHVEPEQWNLHRLLGVHAGGPVTEYARPGSIGDAMRKNSPQALLRDLFRPVKRFMIDDHPVIDTGYMPGDMAKQSIELGVAGRLKLAPVLEPPQHATQAMVEEQTRYRDFVAAEWKIPPRTYYDGPEENPFDEYGLLKAMGDTMTKR